jgi:hypothetical protein
VSDDTINTKPAQKPAKVKAEEPPNPNVSLKKNIKGDPINTRKIPMDWRVYLKSKSFIFTKITNRPHYLTKQHAI